MQRVAALWRLPCRADVKPMGRCDVHVLVGAFADATSDDGEVFFLITAGRMCVDKGSLTGFKVAIANDAGFHVLGCHCVFPLEFPWVAFVTHAHPGG